MRYMRIYKKCILIFATVIGISSLGVNSATSIDSNQGLHNVTTKDKEYIFASEYEDYFKLSLVDNSTDKTNTASTAAQLDVTITNIENTLFLSGMEPFAMSELLSGVVSLSMEYKLVDFDLQNGLLLDTDEAQDLGNIPFQLSVEEPYWRISNKNGQWGIGNTETLIPNVVSELLPKSLVELRGYNNISSYKNGVAIGTISIKQLVPIMNEVPEINLSSLGLSEEINQKIIANDVKSSSLEIMANYNFRVSFGIQVQGVATVRMYVNVIHDLKPLNKLKRNPKTYLLFK